MIYSSARAARVKTSCPSAPSDGTRRWVVGEMASQMEHFAQFCAEQGRPELLELLPKDEGAAGAGIEIDVKGSRCARPLDDDDATVLATGIVVAGLRVTRLSLPYHSIGDAGAAALSTLLLGEETTGYEGALEVLDLRGNAIADVGCAAIADGVKKSRYLRSLDLSWNPLGKRGGYHLAEMLDGQEVLLELKLAHTDLDTAAIIAICSILRGDASALAHLDIGGARLAAEQHEDVAKHAATMLGLNRRLQSLCLANCRIGDDSVAHLAQALRTNTSLTCLDLRANRVKASGAAALADVLLGAADHAKTHRSAFQPPLKILDLGHNAIGDEGAIALADAVAKECSLYELHVGANDVDDAGLDAIAKACHQPNNLRYVAAWGNRFGPAANAEFHHLYNSENDCYIEMDFVTYEVDGKLKAAENAGKRAAYRGYVPRE